jgi:hypothetical protein
MGAEKLTLYAQARTVWTIVSGTGVYTVGTGGTVNVVRPVYIDQINFQDTSPTLTTEYPLSDLTDDAYAGIVLKTLSSPFPASWSYDATFPLGTLTLWPKPTSTSLQGVMYSPVAVPNFPLLTTVVSLPPGYEEYLTTTLALRLATPYGRQVDPSLKERQTEARSIVKRANAKLMDLSFEAGALIGNGGGSFDIRTGP